MADPEMDAETVEIQVLSGLHEVSAADWDACAGSDNPFVGHAFLSALEDSGCVAARTGWMPRHLAVRDHGGRLVACCPAYLKNHSQGEYVFDYGWADAFERAGGRYYPKIQVSVPFSPVPGPRLLTHPDVDGPTYRGALVSGLAGLCDQYDASSAHITFCTETEWREMGEAGLIQRLGQQFHWENRGYGSFDDFLADLSSRKRKNIRKEREKAQASGIALTAFTGASLEEKHWDAFYRFYLDTSDRKWGPPYLNRDFFSLLGERLADKVVLFLGHEAGAPEGPYLCGALNLQGTDTLYGRNWGCVERVKFMHFEACYYRAIDWAIEKGLSRVEAGAQGAHKIQRGYLPTRTYSAHYIAHPGFREAVANAMDRERDYVEMEMDAINAEMSPFKKDG